MPCMRDINLEICDEIHAGLRQSLVRKVLQSFSAARCCKERRPSPAALRVQVSFPVRRLHRHPVRPRPARRR